MSERPAAAALPKICGADVELGNFVLDGDVTTLSGAAASRALLREVDGCRIEDDDDAAGPCGRDLGPAVGAWYGAWGGGGAAGGIAHNPRDWGRRYLSTNGGCVYIDLDHLELCLPEVTSAQDHVAAWHAMLRVARRALAAANRRQPAGRTIKALANNSDGLGQSWGGHLNVLVTRRAWRNLFWRKMQYLMYLAAYQVSSIVFAGQGKVGGENGRGHVDFQLSQRADFIETLTGPQTTYQRPICNSRDEPLAGCGGQVADGDEERQPARLHVIFYDSNLCHVAGFLKIGVLQIVLAMIERECVDTRLVLDDPVAALHAWSRDPGLTVRARLLSGRETTALDLQRRFLDAARRFAAGGGCDGVVPGHAEILGLWQDTLDRLAEGDLEVLARRLDWALKRLLLERALARHPGLGWRSPELKHLDQIYASLDPDEGLYWACERAGTVERVASEERIARLVAEPPGDTRAWTRAMLLRRAGEGVLEDVDWDRLRVRVGAGGRRARSLVVRLPDPAGHTRRTHASLFAWAQSLDEVLAGLGAVEVDGRRAGGRSLVVGQGGRGAAGGWSRGGDDSEHEGR